MSAAIHEAAIAAHPFVTTQGTDYKAWAKRILYRIERGDKTLLSVQIKFAQMAMDIQPEVSA